MEKIIFFILVIPILIFVFYLGGSAIMKGFKAKVENAPNINENEESSLNDIDSSLDTNSKLSDELTKLNELLKSGVLTKEEFDQAKKKILDN
tara:strand:+ start:314 stop:589 length:276 start_codon:yes stop_codon:yes gene_type:complete